MQALRRAPPDPRIVQGWVITITPVGVPNPGISTPRSTSPVISGRQGDRLTPLYVEQVCRGWAIEVSWHRAPTCLSPLDDRGDAVGCLHDLKAPVGGYLSRQSRSKAVSASWGVVRSEIRSRRAGSWWAT